jgi:membrane protein
MTLWQSLIEPAHGFLDRIQKAKLGMAAASVAFFGFLALFPGAALVIAIWGVGADPAFVRAQIEPLKDILPPEGYALFSSQVQALVDASTPGLGWATLVSALIALWSARAGASALVSGLNAVHHLPDRGGLVHEILSILLTIALVGITLAALLAAVIVPLVLEQLPLGTFSAVALHTANLLLGFALAVLGLSLAYRFGPNRSRPTPIAFFTPGVLVALVLWLLVSRGFALYLANFNSYNKIYGSIGAIAALMMWFYFSAYAVLLGAAVDAERAASAGRKEDDLAGQ